MATTTSPLLIRRQIRVRGIVQGVGFRPFVYNLARELGLSGYVFNSSAGVRIEIEGADESIQKFLDTLQHRPPPLALIAEITVAELEPLGDDDFVIRAKPLGSGRVRPGVARCGDVRRVLARLRRSPGTAALDIPLPTAPIADRATPSFKTFPTIAR